MFAHEFCEMTDLPALVNVVPPLAVCFEPGRLCLVMRLMERGTVWECVQRAARGILPEEYVGRQWAFQLYLAHECAVRLAALHELSSPVLHRDVKAVNFLVDAGWKVFVADLGFSKKVPESKAAPSTSAFTKLTG